MVLFRHIKGPVKGTDGFGHTRTLITFLQIFSYCPVWKGIGAEACIALSTKVETKYITYSESTLQIILKSKLG